MNGMVILRELRDDTSLLRMTFHKGTTLEEYRGPGQFKEE